MVPPGSLQGPGFQGELQGAKVRQEICFHGAFCHTVQVMEADVADDGVREEDSEPQKLVVSRLGSTFGCVSRT